MHTKAGCTSCRPVNLQLVMMQKLPSGVWLLLLEVVGCCHSVGEVDGAELMWHAGQHQVYSAAMLQVTLTSLLHCTILLHLPACLQVQGVNGLVARWNYMGFAATPTARQLRDVAGQSLQVSMLRTSTWGGGAQWGVQGSGGMCCWCDELEDKPTRTIE